ncbi:MAG: Tad domain-containing protein [bacterium]
MKEERGVIGIIVVILLGAGILTGIAALVIDGPILSIVRNELQTIADATVLRGAGILGDIYKDMKPWEQQGYICEAEDQADIREAVRYVAGLNSAAGEAITIADSDIKIGIWDWKEPDPKQRFKETLNQPDAVRVIVRKDGSTPGNSPVATFFARFFSMKAAPAIAYATSSLIFQHTMSPGSLSLTVGVSERIIDDPSYNGKEIWLSPYFDESQGDYHNWFIGWHTYDMTPSFHNFKWLMEAVLSGEFTSPEVKVNDTCNFVNVEEIHGASNFFPMKKFFDDMKGRNDGEDDADNDPETWTMKAVIYEDEPAAGENPPVGGKKIAGFTLITLTEIINYSGQAGTEYGIRARFSATPRAIRSNFAGLVE